MIKPKMCNRFSNTHSGLKLFAYLYYIIQKHYMLKYLKIFQYVYLVAAVFFLMDAINTWNSDRNHAYLSIFLFALAIFMFLFRRRFHKKYENENKNK